MKRITVEVRDDHLEVLARSKPMNALVELVWNALDAEATEVRVAFEENDLGGVECVRITDNGHGLSYAEAHAAFGNLGGSWKRGESRTGQRRRVLHGQYGKGRFRAFSLGNRVCWHSVAGEAGAPQKFHIEGAAVRPGEFRLSPAVAVSEDAQTGVVVEISDVVSNIDVLRGAKATEEITNVFALYLRQYPNVRIVYDGVPLDPAHAEDRYTEYGFGEMVMPNGERIDVALAVVEWNLPGKRGVLLCDEHGFMLFNALPRLHFRGFSYTAYVKSAHLAALDREGLLQTGELTDDLRVILDAVRSRLREHFTLREAERAHDTVAEWKELDIYPYEGPPKDPDEENERRIFDIYATHLHQIFPDFAKSSARQKRLTLRLFQELVRAEPTRIARVLDEVLTFPEEKEDEVRLLLGA